MMADQTTELLIVAVLAMLGLILGSFVNALVWRFHAQDELRTRYGQQPDAVDDTGKPLPLKKLNAKQAKAYSRELRELSMSRGRSMCSMCRHPLAAKDLVPLFSWLALGGKCRYCKQKIADPPIIEALMPLLFVGSYVAWPLAWQGYGWLSFAFWLVFVAGFVALVLYDARWFLLPDRIVKPLIALALVQVVLHATVFGGGWPVIWAATWGVVIDSGLFFVLYQLSGGRWIGGGDVKLGIVLGLLAGGVLPALLLIFIASLLGTVASIPMALRGRRDKKAGVTSVMAAGDKLIIPFGPFLIAASMVIVLFGGRISDWLNQALMLY